MIQVVVDRALCSNYGVCVETEPSVFSFGADNQLVVSDPVPQEFTDKARFACQACPSGALSLEERAEGAG